MELTKNFSSEEFRCHDGNEVPCELLPNVTKLAEQLQIIRDEIGAPIHINSGYRSPEYNKKIGGAPKSQHQLAKAADITTKSLTPRKLYDLIEKLITEGKVMQGGLGVYNSWVHYDVRGTKARWDETT